MAFSQDRYARQRQFSPIGQDGQRKIQSSDVAVLGCGALGSVAAELLCRAGVGRIRIIDRDIVEWTNLQRQSLFDQQDAEQGNCKAEAACLRLAEINSSIELAPHVIDVAPSNIDSLLVGCDLVIDATDNFGIRFLLNDWAIKTQTAWVHGGCVGATGQMILFDGTQPPCLRCLVPEIPPPQSVETCDTAGVIGSATHAIASMQVTEALKWLSGNQKAVSRDLLSIDFWGNRIRRIKLPASNPSECIACGQRQFEFLEGGALIQADAALCGRNAVQVTRPFASDVDLQAVARQWNGVGAVQDNRFFVRLTIDDKTQLTLFRDGRAVVQGTDDVSKARSLVDRYVGG